MIEVYAKRRGERCSFFATGHATEGSERDVVCAGVSAAGNIERNWFAIRMAFFIIFFAPPG